MEALGKRAKLSHIDVMNLAVSYIYVTIDHVMPRE